MSKKFLAVLMVLSMLAVLVLSGFGFAGETRIAFEEDTEEALETEDTDEAEETAEEGRRYELGNFSFFLPESDFTLSEEDDYGYYFMAGEDENILEILSETLDEDISQEEIRDTLEYSMEGVFDEVAPIGKIRKQNFTIDGMTALRASYQVLHDGVDMVYDLDVTLLGAKASYAIIISYVSEDTADAEYIRFLDDILFSFTCNEIETDEEPEKESAETPETPEGVIEMAYGETTVVDGIAEFTPLSISFEPGDLLPSDTSSYYSYIEDVEDETYIVISGTVKNLGGETISLQFATNNTFVVNGKYTYTGTLTGEEADGSGFYGYNVKPLKTATFVYYVSVPDELIEMYEFSELEISFNDLINYVSSYEEPAYTLYLKNAD